MITFDKATYNHGNKGPSKTGFRLTVSTNRDDWFNYREYLLCKGFTVRGQMFKEDFCFEIIDSNTFKFTLLNDENNKEYSAENPLKLLKKVYPTKSLSANAMLVFGSPAVQKIASVISGQACSANYNDMYNDKYYSDARKTLKDFLEDFQNNDLQETYIMNGDWSWDKKSNQKRNLSNSLDNEKKTSEKKTSEKKTSEKKTSVKITKKRSMLEEYEDEMNEYDAIFRNTNTRKRKIEPIELNDSNENEPNEFKSNIDENEPIENESNEFKSNENHSNGNESNIDENESNIDENEKPDQTIVPLNDLSSFVWTFDANDVNNDPSFKPIDPELESLFGK